MKEITYSEAIEQVMLHNDYYAPLKFIYEEIWKYKDRDSIKGLTPHMTIQERVQRDPRFTKIGLGIYALTEYLNKLPQEKEAKTEVEIVQRKHTHMQGMLIEIGNINGFDTYTPDKNGIFIDRELGKISTLDSLPRFTYDHILNDSIRFVDVIWFNDRGFPIRLFEVENSTDFRAGFIKFNELQDFRTEFFFVAPENKKSKFDTEKTKSAFSGVANRCGFLQYDYIESWYKNSIDGKRFSMI